MLCCVRSTLCSTLSFFVRHSTSASLFGSRLFVRLFVRRFARLVNARRSTLRLSTFDVRRSTFDVRRSTFDVRRSTFNALAFNALFDSSAFVSCAFVQLFVRLLVRLFDAWSDGLTVRLFTLRSTPCATPCSMCSTLSFVCLLKPLNRALQSMEPYALEPRMQVRWFLARVAVFTEHATFGTTKTAGSESPHTRQRLICILIRRGLGTPVSRSRLLLAACWRELPPQWR